jgi:hypothetical protein
LILRRIFARERARKSAKKENRNDLIFVFFFIFASFRALSRANSFFPRQREASVNLRKIAQMPFAALKFSPKPYKIVVSQ